MIYFHTTEQTLRIFVHPSQKDGRTCGNGPVNYLIFAHRVDIRVVSLDVPYLIDVPLPLPILKNAFGVDVDHKTSKLNENKTRDQVKR